LFEKESLISILFLSDSVESITICVFIAFSDEKEKTPLAAYQAASGEFLV